jgi:HSP20 family protein
MALIRRTEASTFDPWRDVDSRGNWLGFGRLLEARDWGLRTEWVPPVDVMESEGEYRICVALPGVGKAEAKVSLLDGVLTIQGERKAKAPPTQGETTHRLEIGRGAFLRSFSMPSDADENAVSARMDDGILEVTIRKASQSLSAARDVNID